MEQSPLISIGLPIALFVIMIGIGLTLTAADFQREARQPQAPSEARRGWGLGEGATAVAE